MISTIIVIYFVMMIPVTLVALNVEESFRDGFWIVVLWPIWLILAAGYGLYQFITYLFYLRD